MKPITPPKRIESDRIILRKYDLKLARGMFARMHDDRKHLRKFIPWVDEIKRTKGEAAEFIKSNQKRWNEFTKFQFSIIRKSDRVFMGNIGVHSIQWEHSSCEFGYWILSEFEGLGYVSEAVRALESEIFRLGFNRIQMRCNARNARSANIPRACGYHHEGTIRQERVELGRFCDTLVFGKLMRDWKRAKFRRS